MAQDLRKLFENEQKLSNQKMPEGHEKRFMAKLDEQLPEQRSSTNRFSFLNIAASVVLLLGLGYATFMMVRGEEEKPPVEQVAEVDSIEKISPQLKKVEDYYLANINMELSKIKYTPETKELFDGYVERLEELSKEYDQLSNELFESGPNERTVTALIDNLKLRLNLLYRLKEKLSELNDSETGFTPEQG